jgi:hypothetical protein
MNIMQRTDALYGFPEVDLLLLKDLLEKSLSTPMEAHESYYRGGLYFCSRDSCGNVYRLQRNFGELGNDWAEEGFKQYPTLLYATFYSAFEPFESGITSPQVGGKLLQRKLAES